MSRLPFRRRPSRIAIPTCVAWILAALVQPVLAQDAPEPFETTTLGVSIAQPLLQPLSAGWLETTGGLAYIESPFYFGRMELGTHVHFHTRQDDRIPSLQSGLIYVGWSVSAALPGRIQVSAGPQLGVYVMHFGDLELAPNARTEQEVAVYGTFRLERPFAKRWKARLSASYGSVLLSAPVSQMYVHVGVGYTFKTPAGIREVLR